MLLHPFVAVVVGRTAVDWGAQQVFYLKGPRSGVALLVGAVGNGKVYVAGGGVLLLEGARLVVYHPFGGNRLGVEDGRFALAPQVIHPSVDAHNAVAADGVLLSGKEVKRIALVEAGAAPDVIAAPILRVEEGGRCQVVEPAAEESL